MASGFIFPLHKKGESKFLLLHPCYLPEVLQLFHEQPQTAAFFAKPSPAHKCFAPALLTMGVDGAEA